ncbi:MAG: hypothetical protein JW909_11375 [Planctomycetes bacterium]|nr:hypothetical protein [Planctomycetota bacterium]
MPAGASASRLSEIRRLLKNHGVTPNRGLGQNFLADMRFAEALAEAARKMVPHGERPFALEIGMGLGHLTEFLVRAGFNVAAAEIDARLAAAALERLERENLSAGVEAMAGDALHKGDLAPGIREMTSRGRYVLACNLPYSIATPVIAWHALHREAWTGAAVMVQKEIAERLRAVPGSAAWSSLGLLARVAFESVEILKTVRAGAFYPRPKVSSAIVSFRPGGGGYPPAGRMEEFCGYGKKIFSQRRKTLRHAARVLHLAVPPGIPGAARVEVLAVAEHLEIFRQNYGP